MAFWSLAKALEDLDGYLRSYLGPSQSSQRMPTRDKEQESERKREGKGDGMSERGREIERYIYIYIYTANHLGSPEGYHDK